MSRRGTSSRPALCAEKALALFKNPCLRLNPVWCFGRSCGCRNPALRRERRLRNGFSGIGTRSAFERFQNAQTSRGCFRKGRNFWPNCSASGPPEMRRRNAEIIEIHSKILIFFDDLGQKTGLLAGFSHGCAKPADAAVFPGNDQPPTKASRASTRNHRKV